MIIPARRKEKERRGGGRGIPVTAAKLNKSGKKLNTEDNCMWGRLRPQLRRKGVGVERVEGEAHEDISNLFS